MVVIAINDSTNDIEIADLNYVFIAADAQKDLTDQFQFSFIMNSQDLKDYVSSGDLIINDGTSDLSIEDGLEHITGLTEYETKNLLEHNLDDHLDVPTPPEGSTMLESNDGVYSWVTSTSGAEHQSLTWTQSPTHNDPIPILGWYLHIDNLVSLSSSTPINTSEKGYNSHFAVSVSNSVGIPFTIRITGISVDVVTNVITPDDTEDLSITANGFYQTTKAWIDDVQLSILEGSKSCTLDIYRVNYWNKGTHNFNITGCRLEWEPDGAAWYIQILLYKINNDGEKIIIDETKISSTDELQRGKQYKYSRYKRGDYNIHINGLESEGIVVGLDQFNIRTFSLEVKYDAE